MHPLELCTDLHYGFIPRLGYVEPHEHGGGEAEREEDEEAEIV